MSNPLSPHAHTRTHTNPFHSPPPPHGEDGIYLRFLGVEKRENESGKILLPSNNKNELSVGTDFFFSECFMLRNHFEKMYALLSS